MIIFIDPGHGGMDPGAVGKLHAEKYHNLRIALELRSKLLRDGHTVYTSRYDDVYIKLSDRAFMANRTGAALFVSIHCNGSNNEVVSGIETYIYPGSSEGKKYANAIQAELCAAFPQRNNRGVKETNFAVLRLTKMTSVLVECEFVTNPGAEQFLLDKTSEIAEAIAHGIYRGAQ